MDNRTGTAILLAIVAAGIYRIVVFRRLLHRLDARSLAGHQRRPAPRLMRLRPTGAVPDQLRRHPALRRTYKVRGGDGVALDPTILAPDPA
jgi:hypothetical protein